MAKRKTEPTASDLRDAVLKRMGPMDGPFYPEGASALLDAYVAKLEQNWRRTEGLLVRCRFEEAVRGAVAALV